MELQGFLGHVNSGMLVEASSEAHQFMHARAQEALRVVAELNGSYRTPDKVRALLSELTGQQVDESVALFPPFYSEFRLNLRLGKGVFITMGCRFQDTGGITIGTKVWLGASGTVVPGVPARVIRETGFEA